MAGRAIRPEQAKVIRWFPMTGLAFLRSTFKYQALCLLPVALAATNLQVSAS